MAQPRKSLQGAGFYNLTCNQRIRNTKKMSVILSGVDRSESRDESISSVKNQEYQVATRSTAAIATSNVMEMHRLASHERASTVFHRSRFCRCKRTSITGSTFQIFHGDVKILKNNRNKRPFVIESDEDDWLNSYFFRFQLISTAAFSCSIITDARNIYIYLRCAKSKISRSHSLDCSNCHQHEWKFIN